MLVLVSLAAIGVMAGWLQFMNTPSSPESQLVDDRFISLVHNAPQTIKVSTNAVIEDNRIHIAHTCDGDNIMPIVTASHLPENTKSLALIVYDPDAPRGTFIHWLVVLNDVHGWIYTLLSEKMIEGTNDFGHIDYDGPCPPHGDKPHRYIFLVLALDKNLELERGFTLDDLLSSARNHVIAYGYLIATYSR